MAGEMLIGVDVAKDELVVDDGSGCLKLANAPGEIGAWLAGLPGGGLIGLEATGGCHQLLADMACGAGLAVYVLNPRDVRHYAEGVGRRGKTDRVDAAVIRRFVERGRDGLRPSQPAAEVLRELARLQRRRASVVSHRQALKKSLSGVAGLDGPLRLALKQIDGLLDVIDRKLREGLSGRAETLAGAKRVRTVPGIGEQTSTQRAVLFERVPLDSGDSAVAFVGMDPRPCDSGKKRGHRRLSKRGPSELRRLLYNCAQSGARTKVWKPYYEKLCARGLPSTAAYAVLGRKLLRIAFALWKQPGGIFEPGKVPCLC